MVADLRRLHALTGGPDGARRLAWTAEWRRARAWLVDELAAIPASAVTDEAGNLWATLPGEGSRTIAVGSHLDSVPGGGWLDGALGVVAALEVLRAAARAPGRPCPLALVDWADEEGARFATSLVGSSLAAGRIDPAAIADLRDQDGERLADVLAANGVTLADAPAARTRLVPLAAYLELHIEQGPVLEAEGLAVAAVSGTAGVERHVVTFAGRSGHAGTTPMAVRRDPLVAAARLIASVREDARTQGGVATVGAVELAPGIPTAVPGRCRLTLDQRHPEAPGLAALVAAARDHATGIAAEEGCGLELERRFAATPAAFDPSLVELAANVCQELAGTRRVLPSGALHDATAVSSVVPTAMLFTSSTGGISHAADEDTPVEHVELAVRCLARLVERAAAGG